MNRSMTGAPRAQRLLVVALLTALMSGCGTSDAPADDVASAGDDAAVDAGGADAQESDALEPDVHVPNTADPLGLPLNKIPQGDEFMVAVVPDTQIYAQSFPQIFERHMRWIADRAKQYNIVFVTHVGDIVQTGEKRNEWDNAVAAYDWLRDADVPHGLAIGSHDFSSKGSYKGPIAPCDNDKGPSCKAQMYIEHFGAQLYKDKAWYGGASPSGESSYQLIEAGGLKLLFLHLMHDTPPAELTWAGEVLDAHPDRLVHLTTHRYMFDYRLTEVLPSPLDSIPAGRFNGVTYLLGGQSAGPTTAIELFNKFISTHPNIFMVHCGHVDAEFKMVDANKAGLPVYQTLVDFQDMAQGGGGWLRLLHFKPAQQRVEALTVSTETGELRDNGDGFEHSIAIVEYYKSAYGDYIKQLGLDMDMLDKLLESIKAPGPDRDAYYESLYGAGARDSRYSLQVNFQAYVDAAK